MKNKRGGDKIISVYWFAILFIVAAGIVYMAALFYGAPYDARGIESELLTNQIAGCLSQGGYLKEGILGRVENDLLEECNLNFAVEDKFGWTEQEQYYVEVGIYEFDQEAVDGVGGEIFNIVEGNINLKTSYILEQAEEQKGNKEMVVIHFTAGSSAKGAIETLRDRKLSIHYLIEKDGTVISKENVDVFDINRGHKAFEEERRSGQHAGCKSDEGERVSCEGNAMPEPGEKCCTDLNRKSIGIEIVNLGYICGDIESCKENRGISITDEIWEDYVGERYDDENFIGGNLIWEEFTEKQIDSLVDLVGGIVVRNSIPIDRKYIVGHDESAQGYKWDPGPAFPWDEFMNRLKEEERLGPNIGRNFYVIDTNNQQYVIKILSLVGKTEKNVA